LIVVTRYFGGILLGTGGLTRAYSQSAKAGLENALSNGLSSPLYYGVCLSISCNYALSGKLQYIFAQDNIQVMEISYGEGVVYNVIVPRDSSDAFRKKIIEATNACAEITAGENVSYIIKNNQAVIY